MCARTRPQAGAALRSAADGPSFCIVGEFRREGVWLRGMLCCAGVVYPIGCLDGEREFATHMYAPFA